MNFDEVFEEERKRIQGELKDEGNTVLAFLNEDGADFGERRETVIQRSVDGLSALAALFSRFRQHAMNDENISQDDKLELMRGTENVSKAIDTLVRVLAVQRAEGRTEDGSVTYEET